LNLNETSDDIDRVWQEWILAGLDVITVVFVILHQAAMVSEVIGDEPLRVGCGGGTIVELTILQLLTALDEKIVTSGQIFLISMAKNSEADSVSAFVLNGNCLIGIHNLSSYALHRGLVKWHLNDIGTKSNRTELLGNQHSLTTPIALQPRSPQWIIATTFVPFLH
jgi:hypothetical protein